MAWTSVVVMQNIAEKSCRKRPLIPIIGSLLGVIFNEPLGVSLFFRLQSAVVVTDEVADLIGHRQEL